MKEVDPYEETDDFMPWLDAFERAATRNKIFDEPTKFAYLRRHLKTPKVRLWLENYEMKAENELSYYEVAQGMCERFGTTTDLSAVMCQLQQFKLEDDEKPSTFIDRIENFVYRKVPMDVVGVWDRPTLLLTALRKGTPRDLYHRAAARLDDDSDYELLKEALLRVERIDRVKDCADDTTSKNKAPIVKPSIRTNFVGKSETDSGPEAPAPALVAVQLQQNPFPEDRNCKTCGDPGHITNTCPFNSDKAGPTMAINPIGKPPIPVRPTPARPPAHQSNMPSQPTTGTRRELPPSNRGPKVWIHFRILMDGTKIDRPPSQQTCTSCNVKGHISQACPNSSCNGCKKKGHTAVLCPQQVLGALKEGWIVCERCLYEGHLGVTCRSNPWCNTCEAAHIHVHCERNKEKCGFCGIPGHTEPFCNKKKNGGAGGKGNNNKQNNNYQGKKKQQNQQNQQKQSQQQQPPPVQPAVIQLQAPPYVQPQYPYYAPPVMQYPPQFSQQAGYMPPQTQQQFAGPPQPPPQPPAQPPPATTAPPNPSGVAAVQTVAPTQPPTEGASATAPDTTVPKQMAAVRQVETNSSGTPASAAENPDGKEPVSVIFNMANEPNQVKVPLKRTRGCYFYTEFEIRGALGAALLDTGAQVSLIETGYYKQNLEKHYPLNEDKQPCVGFDNKTIVYTKGCIEAPVEINGVVRKAKLHVMDTLPSTMILGIDLLDKFEAEISYRANEVRMMGELVPTYSNVPREAPEGQRGGLAGFAKKTQICRLAFAENIPAKTTKWTRMVVPDVIKHDTDVMVQPWRKLQLTSQGAIARGLHTVKDHSVLVPITNPHEHELQLKAGAPLVKLEEFVSCAAVLSPSEIDEEVDDLYGVHDVVDKDHDRRKNYSNWVEETKKKRERHVRDFINQLQKQTKDKLEFTLPPGLSLTGAPLTKEQEQYLSSLMESYSDVFADKDGPHTATDIVQHRIETTADKPIKQRMHRNPMQFRAEAARQIQDMLDKGIIRPSNSPWASPVVLAKKKDGTLRFCIDYRRLNAVTRKDSFPLPRIDETLAALSGAKFFSTVDLQSGYWQIEMAEEDIEKTAFISNEGLFEFTVMPFGLSNAPATFQRLMQFVVSGLLMEQCLCYIDDVIIFSQTFDDHLYDLDQVFGRFRRAKLKLKPSKCELVRQSVNFLGHVVSKDGIAPNPEKVESIQRVPKLESIPAVRSFLGMTGYYRQFVPNYGVIAAPLYDATKALAKGERFSARWSPDLHEAFRILKEALLSAPILAYPNMEKPFLLYTDASNAGVGYALAQVGEDGKEHPIHFGSKKFTDTETRYSITEKECLAVVRAFTQFRQYLLGNFTTVFTDHKALIQVLDRTRHVEQITNRLFRLALRMAEYDYEVKYLEGKKNVLADALSRPPFVKPPSSDAGTAEEGGADQRDPVSVNLVQPTISPRERAIIERLDIADKIKANLHWLHQVLNDTGPNADPASPSSHPSSDSHDRMSNTVIPPAKLIGQVRLDMPAQMDDPLQEGIRAGELEAEGDTSSLPAGASASNSRLAGPGSFRARSPTPNPDEPAQVERSVSDAIFEEFRSLAAAADPEGGWPEGPQTLKEAQQAFYDEFFAIDAPWDMDAVHQAQDADPELTELIHFLRYQDFPPMTPTATMNKIKNIESQFMYYNGILYKYVRKNNPNRKFSMYQLVVPKIFRQMLMEQYHSSKYGGHLGFDKVYPKLTEKFFWPGQAEDLRLFQDACIPCLRQKIGPVRRGALRPRRALAPFHMVAVDVMGPMPESTRGNKYVVSFVDYYTKYPISFATPDATAETIVRLLHQEIIPDHGVPRIIVCDRGPCFTSKHFRDAAADVGVKLSMTSPYHHRSNGLVERWQRTLTGMLKPAADMDCRNWDDLLKPAVFAYRTAPHASTGETPFFLYHGRDATQPGVGETLMATTAGVDVAHYGEKLVELVKEGWARAEAENLKSQEYQKEHHDRRITRQHFVPGDLVIHRERKREGRMERAGGRFHPEFHWLYRVWKVDHKLNRLTLGLVEQPTKPYVELSAEEFKFFAPTEEDYTGYMHQWREARAAAADEEAMRGVKCGACEKDFYTEMMGNDANEWAECTYCLQWYHFRCAGLAADPPDIWHCPNCEERMRAG
jgi:hypothetical protein